MPEMRSQWGSKIGFILAASGSAIGLGNVVFFSANAYKYGGGAFYIPYIVAFCVLGIPIMLMELALGAHTGKAFPQSLYRIGKRPAEFVGWWGVLNATVISMYYVAILGWVLGMFVGSMKGLWSAEVVTTGAFGALGLSNPFGYFFKMLGSWDTLGYVAVVWALNFIVVVRGARSIESATRFLVPLMWVCMVALILRGVSLPNGEQGAYLLFSPNFTVMADPEVWKGAFSQMFFTLSLGFGIMTAYASYLPKKSDQVHNAATISFLNCSFEFVAGLAVFSLLFAFSVVPKASTLSMMFFVVPQGIGKLPHFVSGFGMLFFFLLFIAGLTSSVSLVESFVAALIDKFHWKRKNALAMVIGGCALGSMCFALPKIVDPNLTSNGTLGLTLLDLFDHWSFSYGLLLTGFFECLIVGWIFGAHKLREIINRDSTLGVGWWWDVLIKVVNPLIIAIVIAWGIWTEVRDGLYGDSFTIEGISWLPWLAFGIWVLFTTGLAIVFTYGRDYPEVAE
jgi:NSS family neurotransmitter:Na+ symporter